MEETKPLPPNDQWLREGKKDLELDYFYAREILKGSQQSVIRDMIANDILDTLSSLKEAVTKSASAEEVFKTAFKGLNRLEQKQFLMSNLLEGLKRGDSPAKLLKRYEDIGIFQPHPDQKERLAGESRNETTNPEDHKKGLGNYIDKCLQVLKRSGLTLCSLVCASIKNIPAYVKFEPTIRLGTGLIPGISIGFGNNAEFTGQDLIDKVKLAWWESGLKMSEEDKPADSTTGPDEIHVNPGKKP